MGDNQPTRQVVPVTAARPIAGQPFEQMAFFSAAGVPLSGIGVADTGATVVLTGYAAHAVGNVAATDTANVAIAKLEARIAALEAA